MRVFTLCVFFVLGLSACGATKSRCRPETCTGCCTAEDICVAGTTPMQCGTGGNLCDTCVGSQVCGTAGRCLVSTVVDGGADAGMDVADAGADAGVATTGPIVAPNDVWTWVDFPESRCGRGTPTGIGINPTTLSNDLIVFMQGGGACWNNLSCSLGFAQDLDGYDSRKFATEGTRTQVAFNRTNQNNPFRTASFVFIPYCTGDVHIGDTLSSYGIHHRGAANVRAFLARLKDTFPNVTRVWLTGSSAGGYGVQLNYHKFAEAFPRAEVHGLADSAQMLNPPDPAQLTEWIAAWAVTDPPGCAGCTADFTRVPGALAATYPNRRFGLVAFSKDSVLINFFSHANQDAFAMATNNLLSSQYDGKANLKYFLVEPAMPSHVMLDELFVRTAGGVPLSTFVRGWALGEPGWANVRGN